MSTRFYYGQQDYIVQLNAMDDAANAAFATVSADWNATTGTAKILNKPILAAVATSGNKADVGLGNVDNTSDVNKPVSTAQQTALNAKADKISPTFTGTVTATSFAGSLAWSNVTGRPTTLAGYGITDAGTATSVAWSGVTGKPTTLSGYGITDALSSTGTAANSNMLAGVSMYSAGGTGGSWPYVPRVAVDGVMEVGRYVDFHAGSSDGIDYSARFDAGVVAGQIYLQGYRLVTADGGSYNLNAGTATKLATPRLINGVAFDGSADITLPTGTASSVPWSGVTGKPTTVAGYGITDLYTKTQSQGMQSSRDFPNGTLVTTSIDYSVSDGAAWLAEIKGNSYGSGTPFNVSLQGYIYSNTMIQVGGTSVGTDIGGVVVINVGGKLCFWWPSGGYWQGFTVFVADVTGQGPTANTVTAITNSAKPAGTKEVAIPVAKFVTSTGYVQNTSRFYATGGTYGYGQANPYYMDMQYNATTNRWRLAVTPGTPANVEVYFADYTGGADKVYITTDEAASTQFLTMNRGGGGQAAQYNSGYLYYVAANKTLWTSYYATIANGSGKTLVVGGAPQNNANTASLCVTSGNVHLDSTTGSASAIYLNYYGGTGGVRFGNGASGTNADVSAAGVYSGQGFNGPGTGLTGVAASLTAGYASNLVGNYIGGGAEKPNYFGSNKLRLQMLNKDNLNGVPTAYWNDVLWMSSYAGGDVPGSNALIMGKDGEFIGFARQNFDSASWGTVRTIWHSGHADAPAVNEVGNSIVKRDPNGYIFGSYINMVDHGVNGAGSGVTSIICKQGDNYYRSTGAAAVKTFLGLADANAGSVAYTTPVRDSAAGLNAATYNSYVGDSGYLMYGVNTTASNSAQFYIKNNLAGVEIGNARGGVRLFGAATNLTGAPAYTNGSDGWFRSEGACGWYNASYGTGIFSDGGGMVKTYNSGNFTANTFYGSGAGLTGTASSLTAGNANSISSATGLGYTWGSVQYFLSNKGSGAYVGSQNSYCLEAYSSDGGAAAMSFHRGGYYALNLGLDPDNVFRIGGWSAGANLFQMDMSGNLTMAGNVTAYSDERLKTNWKQLSPTFLQEWAGVKSGQFDRIDTGEQQIGLGAQHVQKVLPLAVSEMKDGTLVVNYGAASAVATVELAKEVLELRAELLKQSAIIKLLMEKAGY